MELNSTKMTLTESKAELLRSVARMYYILGMNQEMIANKLSISRSSIARFLAEARECGIVEIRVNGVNDATRCPELEEQLMKIYKLRDIVVVSGDSEKQYCVVAAQYIKSLLPYKGTIAIGGGRTLFSIGQCIHTNKPYTELQCVQSTGIMCEAVPSTAVVQTWAANLNAAAVYLSVPAIAASDEAHAVLINDPMYERSYELMKKADICLLGIGTVAQLFDSNLAESLLSHYQEELHESCVGDVCFHLYNCQGDFCMPEWSKRVCGLSQVDYLRIPVRAAAAFGPNKVQAIAGALRGRLVNILITNEKTARQLAEI